MGIKEIDSLTIENMKPITVSFKKEEDELELYKWILRKCKSGKSSYIKDRLREIKESEEDKSITTQESKQAKVPLNNNNLIELDF